MNQSQVKALLNHAYRERRVLRISYQKDPGAELIERDVEVYALDGNYFDAYCRLRKEKRTFRLDRVVEASLSSESFATNPHFEEHIQREGWANKPSEWQRARTAELLAGTQGTSLDRTVSRTPSPSMGEHKGSAEKDKNVRPPDLAKRILDELARKPSQPSSTLAHTLGATKQEINQTLYGALRNNVVQNQGLAWSLRSEASPASAAPRILDTPLANLAGYYLNCLSQDGATEVSVWATSKHDSPLDYAELQALPVDGDLGPVLARPDCSEILQGSLGKRMSAYVGYPVRIHRFRSQKGNWCVKLEPVLLLEIIRQDDGQTVLDTDRPRINLSVIKALSGGQETAGVTDEWISLGRDLGISAVEGSVGALDDIALRLRSLRPEWDWVEDTDPARLAHDSRLSESQDAGIYNRAVIVRCDAPRYTKGLEQELAALESVPTEQYRNTALGAWLEGAVAAISRAPSDSLLEVVPLNLEQRQAVDLALTQPLTVITGPPGTGKSQVVSAILANAALRGMRVLLSSKNNKAVDVVEERVNGLGEKPILLRLGTSKYQEALRAYITKLLSTPASESDRLRHAELRRERAGLLEELVELDRAELKTIELRNACDAIEQEVEAIRASVGEECFATMRAVDVGQLLTSSKRFGDAVGRADRTAAGFWRRLFWPFSRVDRFKACCDAWHDVANAAATLGIFAPAILSRDEEVPRWKAVAAKLAEQVHAAEKAARYFSALAELGRALPLEVITQRRIRLHDRVESNAREIWRLWTVLQSDRLDAAHRQLLTQYASILQMVAQGGQSVSASTWRTYYELSNKVVGILPCWATTTLSAHGRIPFDPGYFDLLVIDEASQCDIPSALPLLFRAKRAVIIGDPQQLPHITQLQPKVDQQLLEQRGLLGKYSEWAYSTCNLYSLAASRTSRDSVVMLLDHHRSHADIIGFSNEQFYDRKLRVATKHDRLKRPEESHAVRWIDVKGQADSKYGSWVNLAEASAVLAELRRLVVTLGYQGTLGVVTPFRAQKNLINEMVTQDGTLAPLLATREFIVDSAHGFQGDERDAIIMSPVVTRHMPEKTARWLDRTPNLFNVAITRARGALIVLGDRSAPAAQKITLYEDFLKYVDSLGSTRVLGAPTLELSGPAYPRLATNVMVSDWEKVLYGALFNAGLRTIPQYPVEKYLVDLALVLGERRLAIEVDGEMYHRAWNGEITRRDQIRNRSLIEQGWDVVRFWVYQVRDELPACVNLVSEWVARSSRSV